MEKFEREKIEFGRNNFGLNESRIDAYNLRFVASTFLTDKFLGASFSDIQKMYFVRRCAVVFGRLSKCVHSNLPSTVFVYLHEKRADRNMTLFVTGANNDDLSLEDVEILVTMAWFIDVRVI